jgi:hypothetical protein
MATALATAEAGRDPARAAHLVAVAVDQMRLTSLATAFIGLREFMARTRSLDAAEIREARQLIHDSGILAAA